MSTIKISNMSYAYEGSAEYVFKEVSLIIDTEWKLGLVGRNGKGKTTFMHILAGLYRPEGEIVLNVDTELFPYVIKSEYEKTENVIISILGEYLKLERQMEDSLKNNNQVEYFELLEQYIAIDGYNIRDIIKNEIVKIGLNIDILDKDYSVLSGGEKTKVLIATLFLKGKEFVMLDEPTNHLDYEGRVSLANYLKKKKGFIVASHDREFINMCADHILSINRKTIEIEQGNYDSWEVNKRYKDKNIIERKKQLTEESIKVKNSQEEIRVWMKDAGERSLAKFSSRVRAMDSRLMRIEEEKQSLIDNGDSEVDLKCSYQKYRQDRLMLINKATIGYNEHNIVENISFDINVGDRIVIQGGNGCGKSTLIKAIIERNCNYGDIIYNKDLKISYIPQIQHNMCGNIENFLIDTNINISLFYTVLFQLGFERKDLHKDIDEMSDGQRKKILIAKALIDETNIYIWDEPLNYLDIINRRQLEDVVMKYNVTMLFVEHDIAFVNRVANKRIVLQ